VRLDENRQGSGHTQPLGRRKPSCLGIIQKNTIGLDLQGEGNGFSLSSIKVQGGINDSRRLNSQPRRRCTDPRSDGIWRLLPTEFSENRRRNENSAKEVGQDVILLEKNEVIERACVRNNNHREAFRSSRRLAQSVSRSERV